MPRYEWCDPVTVTQVVASIDEDMEIEDYGEFAKRRVLATREYCRSNIYYTSRPEDIQCESVPSVQSDELRDITNRHFQQCAVENGMQIGEHTFNCDCMERARDLLLLKMQRQLHPDARDWCLHEVGNCMGSPWFLNFCLAYSKSEGEFHGYIIAGGAKGGMQLRAWDMRILQRFRCVTETHPLQNYVFNRLEQFLRVRELFMTIQNEFYKPSYNPSTGTVILKAKQLPVHCNTWHAKFGFFVHGTRMECLKSILKNGLRDSRTQETEAIFWGCRILESTRAQGVYTYALKDIESFGGGYSTYSHMFGDGWLWAPSIYVVGDYDQRVTPTVRKQVIFPAQYVFVAEIHLHIVSYHSVPNNSTIMPVWVPQLEM